MKKQLAVALGLAVLAAPAFASKARLLALGEDTDGSFFVNDNRNIFLNAANVNNHKDMVTFEWGTGGANDSDTAPNAEGGVIMSHNNLVYGIHLGRQTSFNSELTSFSATAFEPSNVIDLFVGGDAGLKWGANLTYASSQDENFNGTDDAEAKSLDLNFGVIMGDITAYVKAGLMGSAEQKANATNVKSVDFERDSEYEVGASMLVNDYTIFAQANMNKYDNKVGNADIENQAYTLGAARTERLNDKTWMFVKLSGVYSKADNGQTTNPETKTTLIPVSIGLEHDANSWLTLRGSVAQNLWSKVDSDANGDSTVANSTNVNAGATLKFGELSIDGMIGTSNNGAVGSTASENGTLAMDNLLTRASVTYRF
jgi:hypothetical protein